MEISKKYQNKMAVRGVQYGLLAWAVLAALALSACEGYGPKQTVGAGAGALAGGLAGTQIGGGSGRLWATGAGVLLGTLLGSEIGSSLDRADRTYMQQAQSRAHAAPLGERIYWNNPDTGHSGAYVPVRDGYSAAGRYCREYQQSIVVGGRTERATGIACQRPDGAWEIMS